jgi:hypothetical protein
MTIPKFEVIQTNKGLQLVSDAGHKHYKPAIEMLLQSEMFIKHNAHLLHEYYLGLCMIEADTEGKVLAIAPLPDDYTLTDYARWFVKDAYFNVDCLTLTVKNGGNGNSPGAKRKERLLQIIELVKKVFNLTEPEYEKTQPQETV